MKHKTLKEIYTGTIYADEEVLAAAPRAKVKCELEFFNLGKYVSSEELEKEYKSRGLVPADLYSLAEWEETHKDDDRKYFATLWRDTDGKFCCATFHRWYGERSVSVYRRVDDWFGYWWFSGVRLVPQVSSKDSETKHLSSDSLPLDRLQNLEVEVANLKAFYNRVIELIPSLEDISTI